MTQDMKDHQFVDRLLANTERLLGSANRLFAEQNVAHGTHFAILCVEECSKCLMYILRSSNPALFAKARYRHLPKYKMFGVFYYIMGALSVIYYIKLPKAIGFWAVPMTIFA